MSWLKLHDSAHDDPKILVLSDLLEIPEAHALGLMAGLWTWCLVHAKDGDLSDRSARFIARAAKWEGDPERFVNAAIEAALIDAEPVGVHDWMVFQGSWKEALYKRASRDKGKTVSGQSGACPSKEERRREEREEREESTAQPPKPVEWPDHLRRVPEVLTEVGVPTLPGKGGDLLDPRWWQTIYIRFENDPRVDPLQELAPWWQWTLSNRPNIRNLKSAFTRWLNITVDKSQRRPYGVR